MYGAAPINVPRVRIPPEVTLCERGVCCWFSSLLREVFICPGPCPQNPTVPNSGKTAIKFDKSLDMTDPILTWTELYQLLKQAASL